MSNYLAKLASLTGGKIGGVYFSVDRNDDCDSSSFVYCYAVYLEEKDTGRIVKVYCIDDEGEYRLFSEDCSYEEVAKFCELGLQNKPSQGYYSNLILESIQIPADRRDTAVRLNFSGPKKMYLFSGEYYQSDDGFNVTECDEMLLVFWSEKDFTKCGLRF